jgi:hypothetical protein
MQRYTDSSGGATTPAMWALVEGFDNQLREPRLGADWPRT